ncbi:hypothetical protein [Streptomyces sp. NPDC059142]|uniref:hypothetical protein n=1 Tax=Streptomyces sp. NPDC059142 TaxID=3346739 RepID=UPI00369D76F1
MADLAAWLGGVGGAVGALGGPAGLWAAWNQHQTNRRRRFGPPEELVGLLAKVIDVAGDIMYTYRSEEWLTEAGLPALQDRLDELRHLVRDETLVADLTLVSAQASLTLSAVSYPMDSPERRASVVAQQSQRAGKLEDFAKTALVTLRKRL